MLDRDALEQHLRDKLRDPGTYGVALVVGTLINAYGHLLVPALRTSGDPIELFVVQFRESPGLVSLSILLAYCFPMFVGVYSGVSMRYRNRHFESRSRFPDCKPDPVFRAHPNGDLIEMGEKTRLVFESCKVSRAQDVVGDEVWNALAQSNPDQPIASHTVEFGCDGCRYLVSHAHCEKGAINVYMTRVGGSGAQRLPQ